MQSNNMVAENNHTCTFCINIIYRSTVTNRVMMQDFEVMFKKFNIEPIFK